MTEPIKPFIKWAGGKRSLIEQMEPHLPRSFARYHEPFVGGGALFFHLGRKRCFLSDNNLRLIRTYLGLRDATDEVIALLRSYPHSRDFFLELRAKDVDAMPDAEVAAWFIYLNKTGFNGLYRVNSKNGFNVPFGDYKRPRTCDEPTLRACARQLQGVEVVHQDFEQAARRARKGDLVYFDPPYVPLSRSSSFTSYTQHGFGPDEQRRLRDLALDLKQRGVHVLLSNSSADAVRELYADGFELVEIQARRSINSQAGGRGAVTELLIK
jgi:DNA adenine methylase